MTQLQRSGLRFPLHNYFPLSLTFIPTHASRPSLSYPNPHESRRMPHHALLRLRQPEGPLLVSGLPRQAPVQQHPRVSSVLCARCRRRLGFDHRRRSVETCRRRRQTPRKKKTKTKNSVDRSKKRWRKSVARRPSKTSDGLHPPLGLTASFPAACPKNVVV